MTISQEIVVLDEVAAALHAIASGTVTFDPQVVDWLAGEVGRAADRAQEVADLRAALKLLDARHSN